MSKKSKGVYKSLAIPIVNMSRSELWKDAKHEWELIAMYHNPDGEHCVCDVYIESIYVMQNKLTKHTAHIGAKCIKQFVL
jgi:hypothetical protein